MSQPRRESMPIAPSSWLVPSVLATLCCFPITGVVALYFAAQVDSRWTLDDRKGALNAARRARAWTLTSFALWVLATVVLVATGRLGRLLESGVL